jgi:glycosyltransferase involved in cell wall biosynthesis
VKTLSIVVPCYNEEASLTETARRLLILVEGLCARGKVTRESHIILVDDGSKDQTWSIVEGLALAHPCVFGIRLSRNFGHQAALLAGLFSAKGEVAVTVDADLQDDLDAIEQMIDANEAGAEVVYGVRKRRESDTFFKRFSAECYYRLLGVLGVEAVYNHADYRLLGRRAIEGLRQYGEVNVFLRGIVPQLGFPSAVVHYDRTERFAGESKYPIKKMLAFAWEGITSFSAVPLRFITVLGVVVSLCSLAITVWSLSVRLFTDAAVPGWASTVVPLYLLGGVQMLCIGMLGEYLAKVYLETKRRPHFLIERTVRNPRQPADSQMTAWRDRRTGAPSRRQADIAAHQGRTRPDTDLRIPTEG